MDSASGPLRKDDRAMRDACIVQPCIGFGRSCFPVYCCAGLPPGDLSVLRGPRTQTYLASYHSLAMGVSRWSGEAMCGVIAGPIVCVLGDR